MYSFIVCDDDQIFADHVTTELKSYFKDQCSIYTCYSLENLMKHTKTLKEAIDMLFIDIHLEDISTSYAKQIKELFPSTKIFFFSGMMDLSVDIFEANPSYFLPKPLDIDKFHMVLDKLLVKTDLPKPTHLTFTVRGNIIKVEPNKIIYFESNKRNVTIHTEKEDITIYGKLDEIMNSLSSIFVRCHQSYILNMEYVSTLEKNEFILTDNTNIPISQAKYASSKKAFVNFLSKDM